MNLKWKQPKVFYCVRHNMLLAVWEGSVVTCSFLFCDSPGFCQMKSWVLNESSVCIAESLYVVKKKFISLLNAIPNFVEKIHTQNGENPVPTTHYSAILS